MEDPNHFGNQPCRGAGAGEFASSSWPFPRTARLESSDVKSLVGRDWKRIELAAMQDCWMLETVAGIQPTTRG